MRPALGAGQMVIDADLDACDWRWSPMRIGDVLIHNCQTIHKGLPNASGAMRVSMDCRYQPLSEPVGEKYLGVSHQMRSWEDLYADWEEDDPLKYYWRDLPLAVQPFEYRWYDRRDERAIEMGEAGDPGSSSRARKHIAEAPVGGRQAAGRGRPVAPAGGVGLSGQRSVRHSSAAITASARSG